MIDITQQINSVDRKVGTRKIAVGQARTVTISQTYDAGIEDVWDACTNPERIPRWFLPISGDLRLHGKYQLEGNASGTIEHCEPPHGFAATWEYDGAVSWIEVRMSAQSDERTRFELEHIVMEDEHWAQFGPGAKGLGWDGALLGLSLHLRSSEAVDQAAVADWSMSAGGKRFMQLSGDRWYQADVAGDRDEATARAAADRTIAAFTGGPEDTPAG